MNIGPTEIIVVLAVALLAFGPGRLPQMGRSLGRGLREFKAAAQTAKDELGLGDIVDEVNEVKRDVTTSLGVEELRASVACAEAGTAEGAGAGAREPAPPAAEVAAAAEGEAHSMLAAAVEA